MATAACPHCHRTDRLASIEQLTGACDSTITISDTGALDIEGGGGTDVFWDNSVTVGVMCRDCGWEAEGTDADGKDWSEKLLAVPSLQARIAGLLALRDAAADPDEDPDENDLTAAAIKATSSPEAIAAHRVTLLVPLVAREGSWSDEDWANDLGHLYDTIRDALPLIEDGVLSEPA